MTIRACLLATRPAVILAIAGAAIAACGGGSGTTAPNTTTRYIHADGMQTGWVWLAPLTNSIAVQGNPYVGDLDHTRQGASVRGLFGFSLSTVPSGSHVTSATLQVTVCDNFGSPLTKLGNVLVDHVSYGVPFDTTAYASGTLASNIGTLVTDLTVAGKTLDVTTTVIGDVGASRPNSQYRLRMANADDSGDTVNDYLVFATDSAYSGSCFYRATELPTLVVAFTQ